MAKKKPKESLAELQKQREDLEALLASIEEAYSEGTMPEAQYQEVKAQNEARLQEINEKFDKVAAEGGGEEPAAAPATPSAEAAPTTPTEAAAPSPTAAAPLPEPQMEMPVPEPMPAPAPRRMKDEAPATPAKIELPQELTEMIKGIKDGKIGTNSELIKRVEKVEVDVEKVKSFVDALKDERTSQDERFQRISEELGETRSNLNNMETRLGEVEVKSDETSDIAKNLKPQKIVAALESRDEDMKAIKERIEKTEDVVSNTLKKVGEVRTLLQSLGSIDNLANMSKDIAKKVIIIDDKVKKMERMSERTDTIFGELNKRLEEFMFYKAKQQSVDEMTQDLMRNLEELSTRLDGYAQKTDLDMVKDFLMGKIEESGAGLSPAMPGAAPVPLSGPAADIQRQIDEQKELDKMLDEQKKMGAMKDDEYKKSKAASARRVEELKKKITEAQSSSAPAPVSVPPQTSLAPAVASEPQATPAPEVPFTMPASPKELVKESTPFGEMYKLEEKLPEIPTEEPVAPQPVKQEPVAPVPKATAPTIKPVAPSAASAPEEDEEESEEPEEEEEPAIMSSLHRGMTKKERMLVQLEDSFRSGILSEKAYFRAKKLLGFAVN